MWKKVIARRVRDGLRARPRLGWLMGWALVSACVGPPPKAVCDATCDKLVLECGFAAFPSHQSCVEGCLIDAKLGAPVHTLEDCVSDAECDPFTVLECTRAFGGEQ